MKAKATVRLPFQSEKQLTAIVDALKPEIQRQIGIRSKATLAREEKVLVLTVEAEDIVAFRAALNAYLRWIGSSINVLETLNKS